MSVEVRIKCLNYDFKDEKIIMILKTENNKRI